MASNYILSMLERESERLSLRKQAFRGKLADEWKQMDDISERMESRRQERTRQSEDDLANVYARNSLEKANARKAAKLDEEKREFSRSKFDFHERQKDRDRIVDRKNQYLDTLSSRQSFEGHRSSLNAIEERDRKSALNDYEMFQRRSVSSHKELLGAQTIAFKEFGDKLQDVYHSRAHASDKNRLAWDSAGRASNSIRGSGNMLYLTN